MIVMKKIHYFFVCLMLSSMLCSIISCSNDGKLTAAVEQVSATLPKSLDEDGITVWNSVIYNKDANVLTFEYIYNSEVVTEDAFAASDSEMKSALLNYLRQDAIFMKAMEDVKPDIVYILKLSGKDIKKEVSLKYSEL